MVTTALSKPNHYERLGLTPGATDDEIARAFAVAMSPLMPRSIGDIAEIGLAFETLRDPAKRRAYDASIALPVAAEAEPEPEPRAMFPRDGWPFVASARIASAELPSIDTLRRPAAGPQRAAPPLIASPAQPAMELPRPELLPAFDERLRPVEHGPVEWKRPALAVGALFLGVALTGAGLGWYASRGISPAQAEQSVTFPVPKTRVPAPTPRPADSESTAEAKAAQAKPRAEKSKAPARPEPPEPKSAVVREQKAEEVSDIPSEQVAALASSAAEAPSAMPLADSVIARTIGRIGYACGAVASTEAVEGSPGVFKVTCTSGHAYRAAPVRGRYHFKRWSGR
jgi:curved DNA-binding protein CbpA